MATAYHMEALRKQRVLERAIEAKKRLQEQEEEALAKIEKEEKEKKRKQHRHHHHKRNTRPASAQKITSSPKKSKTRHSPSPSSDKMETSPPPMIKTSNPSSVAGGDSKSSSRCASACKSDGHNSQPASVQSIGSKKQNVNGGSCNLTQSRGSSAAKKSISDVSASHSHGDTVTVSRCSKCRSPLESTATTSNVRSTCTSRTSVTSTGAGSSKKLSSVTSGTRASSSTGSKGTASTKKMAELKAEAVRKDLHQQELVLRDNNLVMGHIPVEEEITLRALQRQKLDATT